MGILREDQMKRILIIGGNGSGKTTMSVELAKITKLPLCHLDSLYWTDGWVPRERGEFLSLLEEKLMEPEWILDGNMRRSLPTRLKYCDTVIYLDFSACSCFAGVLKRLWQNRGKSRPDMGGECIEGFNRRSLKFLFSTLSFNRKNRKYFYLEISKHPNVKLIVLKRRREVKAFLKSLNTEYCKQLFT